jgi:hypothetical protein
MKSEQPNPNLSRQPGREHVSLVGGVGGVDVALDLSVHDS